MSALPDFFRPRPRPGSSMAEVAEHNERQAREAERAVLERERGVAERDRRRAEEAEMARLQQAGNFGSHGAVIVEPGAGMILRATREAGYAFEREGAFAPGRPTYRQLEAEARRLRERLAQFERPPLQQGDTIVFGCPVERKPLVGPEGKVRLRFRVRKPAKVFIRTAAGVESYYLYDRGLYWEPAYGLASDANLTVEGEGRDAAEQPRKFRLENNG